MRSTSSRTPEPELQLYDAPTPPARPADAPPLFLHIDPANGELLFTSDPDTNPRERESMERMFRDMLERQAGPRLVDVAMTELFDERGAPTLQRVDRLREAMFHRNLTFDLPLRDAPPAQERSTALVPSNAERHSGAMTVGTGEGLSLPEFSLHCFGLAGFFCPLEVQKTFYLHHDDETDSLYFNFEPAMTPAERRALEDVLRGMLRRHLGPATAEATLAVMLRHGAISLAGLQSFGGALDIWPEIKVALKELIRELPVEVSDEILPRSPGRVGAHFDLRTVSQPVREAMVEASRGRDVERDETLRREVLLNRTTDLFCDLVLRVERQGAGAMAGESRKEPTAAAYRAAVNRVFYNEQLKGAGNPQDYRDIWRLRGRAPYCHVLLDELDIWLQRQSFGNRDVDASRLYPLVALFLHEMPPEVIAARTRLDSEWALLMSGRLIVLAKMGTFTEADEVSAVSARDRVSSGPAQAQTVQWARKHAANSRVGHDWDDKLRTAVAIQHRRIDSLIALLLEHCPEANGEPKALVDIVRRECPDLLEAPIEEVLDCFVSREGAALPFEAPALEAIDEKEGEREPEGPVAQPLSKKAEKARRKAEAEFDAMLAEAKSEVPANLSKAEKKALASQRHAERIGAQNRSEKSAKKPANQPAAGKRPQPQRPSGGALTGRGLPWGKGPGEQHHNPVFAKWRSRAQKAKLAEQRLARTMGAEWLEQAAMESNARRAKARASSQQLISQPDYFEAD